MDLSEYPSVSRSEAVPAVSAFGLELLFTTDAKYTFANDDNNALQQAVSKRGNKKDTLGNVCK